MSEGMEHIDELFRSKLSEAQMTPPSGVFDAVQSQLASNAAQPVAVQSTSSVLGTSVGLKIAGIVAVVSLSVGGIFLGRKDEAKQVKSSPEKQQEVQESVSLNLRTDEQKASEWKVAERKTESKCVFGDVVVEEELDTAADEDSWFGELPPVQAGTYDTPVMRNSESRNNVKKDEDMDQEIEVQTFGLPELMNVNDDVKPNVFTPNGDGINDSFFVEIKSGEFLEMMILNRAGMKVFGTTDGHRKWAGDHLGMPCAAGTYRVILKTKKRDSDKSDVDQWVLNLIR